MSLILLLGLACYRVTRFLIRDTLIGGTRERIQVWLVGDRPRLWKDKLYELSTCPYCISMWVAAASVALADRWTSVPLPGFAWLAVAAMAMVVWRLVETDEEDDE